MSNKTVRLPKKKITDKRISTFGKYRFKKFVPVKLAQQIIDFWGCFGRKHLDWLDNSKPYEEGGKLPKLYEQVVFFQKRKVNGEELYKRIEGKYMHAWNNMGRVILDDGNYEVVSSCDEWFTIKASRKRGVK